MSRLAFVIASCFTILFVGAYFGSLNQAQQSQSASYAAGHEAHERQQPILRPSEPPADAKPVAEQPKWWEREDLIAQQQVACWTKAIGLMTAVGISLIAWTLWETRRAVAEATSATKAAQASVNVAREIGEAQTRGYVSIIPKALSIDVMGMGYMVSVRCEGGSPVYDFAAQTIYSHHDDAGRRHFGCSEDDLLGKGNGDTLFPGDPKRWFGGMFQMLGFTAPTMSGSSLNLKVELRFWWTDAFRKRQSRDVTFVGRPLSNEPHSTLVMGTSFAGETVTHTPKSEHEARKSWDQRTKKIRSHNRRSLGALAT